MKLILSLTLIWSLCSSAEALQCLYGREEISTNRKFQTCNSDDARCITTHVQVSEPTVHESVYSSCARSSDCALQGQTLSYRTSSVMTTVHCCDTDGCNEAFHHAEVLNMNADENGLQCFSCSDPLHDVCNNTVKCLGVQDRCINATLVDSRAGGSTHLIIGCASASTCEVFSQQIRAAYVPGYISARALQCCGTSFCNSAWTAKLSAALLLFGLIVHFVL